jgi:hypothetical protein
MLTGGCASSSRTHCTPAANFCQATCISCSFGPQKATGRRPDRNALLADDARNGLFAIAVRAVAQRSSAGFPGNHDRSIEEPRPVATGCDLRQSSRGKPLRQRSRAATCWRRWQVVLKGASDWTAEFMLAITLMVIDL